MVAPAKIATLATRGGGGASENNNPNPGGGGSSSVSTVNLPVTISDGPIFGSIVSLMSLQKGKLAEAAAPTNQLGQTVISVAKAVLATINNNDILYTHAVSQNGATVTTQGGGSVSLAAGQAELRSILPTDALKSLGTSALSTVNSSTPGLGNLTNALTVSHITNAKVILLESKVNQMTTGFKLGETLTDATTQAMTLAKNQLPSVESEIRTSAGAAKLLAIAAATKTLIEEVQGSVELSGGITRGGPKNSDQGIRWIS